MDAIIRVLHDIDKSIDSKQPALAIFFDFAKAFDLVPHDLLLTKLQKFLSPFLTKWIAAYLSNKRQCVRISNFETDWGPVKSEAIQCSVLGPILFNLYIADDFIPASVDFEKYADDLINYASGRSTSTCLPQQAIDGVQSWCHINGISG